MDLRNIGRPVTVLTLSTLFSALSWASGLDQLQRALDQLQGNEAITAMLETRIVDIDGSGDDQQVKNGMASVTLHDGRQGLQVTYDNQVLAQIDAESRQKVTDEEAQTPTLNAINRFDATELRSALSASASVKRRLAQAIFLEEAPIDYQGSPARVLNFELPIEAVLRDKRTRQYVKKFEGNYRVIIDENGTPLETRVSFQGKGRAYIVLRIEASVEEFEQYQVIGQRLVRITSESKSGYSTTFGDGQYIKSESLQILPDDASSYAALTEE